MKNKSQYLGFLQYKADAKGWEEGYVELCSCWLYVFQCLNTHPKICFPVFLNDVIIGSSSNESPNTVKLITKDIVGKREIYFSSPNRCEIQNFYRIIIESRKKLFEYILNTKKEKVIVLNQNQGTTFQISTGGIEVFQSLELVEKIKPENIISYTIDKSRDKKSCSLNIKINDGKDRLYKIDPLSQTIAENAIFLILAQGFQRYAPEALSI